MALHHAHAGLTVENMDKALGFYGGLMGMRVVHRGGSDRPTIGRHCFHPGELPWRDFHDLFPHEMARVLSLQTHILACRTLPDHAIRDRLTARSDATCG